MKSTTKFLTVLVILAVLLGGLSTQAVQAGPGDTTRVSVASDGTETNHDSDYPSISADGRYVAFYSYATNLVAGDTNSAQDIFVHDRQTGTTTLVSVASDGTQGNGDSGENSSISSDGRYVAFWSRATNLVAGDTNGKSDVFVHDRQTGTTTRVSVASDGTQGNYDSYRPSLSADGRYVAFHSSADNLVAGDANGNTDIFVHDLQTGTTTRVSVASDGTGGNSSSLNPSISADGRYVAFESDSTNLVAGDTNGKSDVFVHDRQTGTTTRVSVAPDGTQGNYDSYRSSLSADGRYVAFHSSADNLVAGDTNGTMDIFVHDLQTGTTTRVSVASDGTEGNDYSYNPSISADGHYVAFWSDANNLAAGDTNGWGDVFIHDRQAGTTTRVSVDSSGTQANGDSKFPSISADGRYVAFQSLSTNLVAGDTNGAMDIFVHDDAVQATKTFRSVGTYDGWILESAENSNVGGTLDKTATTFNLGDGAQDKQYRAILHFNTSTLPDNAVITKVTLKIKKQGLSGSNPFTILGGLKVDMRKPYFGGAVGLVIGDFQAAAGKSSVATFGATPASNWYSALLNATGRAYVNKTGTTQFRLRFATGDNDDLGADYMKFYSGDTGTTSARPTLVIEYYIP